VMCRKWSPVSNIRPSTQNGTRSSPCPSQTWCSRLRL
jgi:hypothetical protein